MSGSRLKRGRFLSLEGTEGVGKSTHLAFIAGYLSQHHLKVLVTREPGGTPVGERIRTLLLDASTASLPPMSELLLMFAARASHVEQVVRPALAAGTWVLCDRFTDASYAYQGGGRRLPMRYIEMLERWVLAGLKPDLTLLLDAPVQIGLKRLRQRGHADRFEREHATFFTRVRRTYLARARREPRRIQIIQAGSDLPTVQERIRAVLDARLSRWI